MAAKSQLNKTQPSTKKKRNIENWNITGNGGAYLPQGTAKMRVKGRIVRMKGKGVRDKIRSIRKGILEIKNARLKITPYTYRNRVKIMMLNINTLTCFGKSRTQRPKGNRTKIGSFRKIFMSTFCMKLKFNLMKQSEYYVTI
jgi:hypothetical protein